MFDLYNLGIDKLAAVGCALEAIDAIAKWAQEIDRGADAVITIQAIMSTIAGMYEGEITPSDTMEEITLVRRALLGIDHKFDDQ